jgi:hypothetical protein
MPFPMGYPMMENATQFAFAPASEETPASRNLPDGRGDEPFSPRILVDEEDWARGRPIGYLTRSEPLTSASERCLTSSRLEGAK